MEPVTPAAPESVQTLAWQYLRDGGESGMYVSRHANHGATGPHDHVFHEVVYVATGTAEHESVQGVRRLRPGDVIVIRPQVWHAYRSPREFGIVNCLIGPPAMRRLGTHLGKVRGWMELFRRQQRDPRRASPTVLHAGPADRTLLISRLDTIVAEQRQRANGWEAACSAAMLDLLVGLSRLFEASAGSQTGLSQTPVPRLADRTEQGVLDTASHLESHLAEPVSLGELAESVGLSPGHLSRSFGKRMGIGLVQYLHRLRAEEACRLLRCTDDPVTRIAARLGYDEVAYFSRCFRSQVGVSPREYRKRWDSGDRQTGGSVSRLVRQP